MLKSLLLSIVLTGGISSPCLAQEAQNNEPLGSTEVAGERWYLPDRPVPEGFSDNPYASDPDVMYQVALIAFEARDGEAAAYWAYLGQMRYRTLIACDNLGPWSGPHDQFMALNEDIGGIVNLWLGGDVQLWVDTLTQVISEYESAEDPIVPSPRCDAARTRNIQGATRFRDYLVEDYESFRRTREANGLENRTTGPVELREG